MSIASDDTPAEDGTDDPAGGGPIDLGRFLWLITTGTLLVGMTILAFKRDWGYAGVSCAVALSAAINLL